MTEDTKESIPVPPNSILGFDARLTPDGLKLDRPSAVFLVYIEELFRNRKNSEEFQEIEQILNKYQRFSNSWAFKCVLLPFSLKGLYLSTNHGYKYVICVKSVYVGANNEKNRAVFCEIESFFEIIMTNAENHEGIEFTGQITKNSSSVSKSPMDYIIDEEFPQKDHE